MGDYIIIDKTTYKISWDEYNFAIHKIFKDLKELNFVPDVVVCVSRGGLVLGVHLCHLFKGSPKLGVIYAQRHKNDQEFAKLVLPKVTMHMLPNLRNKNVLIAEDTIGTGKTKTCIKNFLELKKPKKNNASYYFCSIRC